MMRNEPPRNSAVGDARTKRTILRSRVIVIFGGILLGALIAAAWATGRRATGDGNCPSGDDVGPTGSPLRTTTGPDGLRRFEPDGCQLDARGFRNATIPMRADVVALGDSNTWGGSG